MSYGATRHTSVVHFGYNRFLSSVCREVFKARNRENKRLVALKKVLMENEKEGVSCFLYSSHHQ